MNNVIDVNDVTTYPESIVKTFSKDIDVIDYKSLFKNFYFKCVHVCCTTNINNYKKYGIMRPLIASDCENFEINKILKKIILEPIKDNKELSDRYDKLLENNYNESKGIIDDWYGKYSCVCYTLDDLNRINQ